MERDPEKKAFARAWNYLSYNPTAKWTALITAAATSLLAVKLLFFLWLFSDLVVHRGQIPSFRELPALEQNKFQALWDGLGNQRQRLMHDIGLPTSDVAWAEPNLEVEDSSGATPTLAEMPLEKQALAWRAYLFHVVREKVGSSAGVLILPAFREVPVSEYEGSFAAWKEVSPDDRTVLVDGLGLSEEATARLTDIVRTTRTSYRWKTSKSSG